MCCACSSSRRRPGRLRQDERQLEQHRRRQRQHIEQHRVHDERLHLVRMRHGTDALLHRLEWGPGPARVGLGSTYTSQFNGYATPIFKSAYASFKPKGGPPDTVGISVTAPISPTQAALIPLLEKDVHATSRRTRSPTQTVFARCPGIKFDDSIVGEFQPAVAKAQMLSYLASHPQPVAGVVQAAGMTSGILQAFQQTGRPTPAIVAAGPTAGELVYSKSHPDRLASAFTINPSGVDPGRSHGE